MEKEIAKIKIDFEELLNWRDSNDIPACSFMKIYRAIGLLDKVENYKHDRDENMQFTALENIAANVDTIIKLKHFIEDVWATYDLMIDGDNHVFWDTKSKYGKKKHYPKKLKAVVRNAVAQDLADYCPGFDATLQEDEIAFVIDVQETEPAAEEIA